VSAGCFFNLTKAADVHCAKRTRVATRDTQHHCLESKEGKVGSAVFDVALAIVATALSGVITARAASYDALEYQALVHQATAKQYVRVQVNLDASVPLLPPENQSLATRSRLSTLENALLAELGRNVLTSTIWRSGLGQIGLYVNPQGLAQLVLSKNARSFYRDPTADGRSTVYDADGRLGAIEREIDRTGFADVEVVQNLESLDFDIGPDGRTTYKVFSALTSEIAAKRLNFLNRLPITGVLDLNQAKTRASNDAPSPAFLLRVNKAIRAWMERTRSYATRPDSRKSLLKAASVPTTRPGLVFVRTRT
jgi:hypothetical protein